MLTRLEFGKAGFELFSPCRGYFAENELLLRKVVEECGARDSCLGNDHLDRDIFIAVLAEEVECNADDLGPSVLSLPVTEGGYTRIHILDYSPTYGFKAKNVDSVRMFHCQSSARAMSPQFVEEQRLCCMELVFYPGL